MTDPNSPLTRLRWWIVRRVQPSPDPGEAWCVGCCLKGGRTIVVSADGHKEHAYLHHNTEGHDHRMEIIVAWPRLTEHTHEELRGRRG